MSSARTAPALDQHWLNNATSSHRPELHQHWINIDSTMPMPHQAIGQNCTSIGSTLTQQCHIMPSARTAPALDQHWLNNATSCHGPELHQHWININSTMPHHAMGQNCAGIGPMLPASGQCRLSYGSLQFVYSTRHRRGGGIHTCVSKLLSHTENMATRCHKNASSSMPVSGNGWYLLGMHPANWNPAIWRTFCLDVVINLISNI